MVYTDGSVNSQGATTIHEDNAAFSVSTSSLTIEVEAITHSLRWTASRGESRTTHATILTDSMNLQQKVKGRMGCPDWTVSMFDIHLLGVRQTADRATRQTHEGDRV